MNRFDRVFSILVLLQSKKIIKSSQIADRYDISHRTVYRDIRTLKDAGIPIIGDPGIGYSMMDGYRLPPMMFSEQEAASLLTAEKLIGKMTDKETQRYYSDAMIKIKSILRGTERRALEVLDDSIAIADNDQNDNKNYLQDLLQSLSSKKVVNIQYNRLDGTASDRNIEPIGCYLHNNKWYLIAYCRSKIAYRTFKLNRIVHLNILEEEFVNKHISLKEYIDQQDREWRKEHRFHNIEILFNKEFVQFAEYRKYYFGFVSQSENEKGVTMRFMNTAIELVARWLMQFGQEATVIAPPELKDRMKVLSKEFFEHYH